MAQEEQNHRCSGSSSGGGGGGDFGGGSGGGGGGGGRPSKKPKQKKIPQRGLGVAQLEKIRLEEQGNKNSPPAFFSDSSTISSSNPSFSSLSLPNYPHSHSSSLIPFPSPSPPHLHSPTSQFRPPNVDVLHSNTVPLPNPISNGGFKIGFSPSIPVSGHGNVPKLWTYELNLEGENPRVDHGLVFQPNLPYESSTIWPLPPLMQRAQPYQPPSSSMVNASSGTSSSSVPNFQIEPPSNQSYYGNNYTSMWPEEEKMVGVKRPYPFSLDNPPGPSFNSKFPTFAAPIRSDESASYGNAGTLVLDPGNAVFREGPSCSTSLSELDSKKGIKENGGSNGDFLTLAPPNITPPHPNTRSKQPPAHPAYYNKDSSEFESSPIQGNAGDPIRPHTNEPLQQHQQLPFYSFLPPANPQNGTAATSSSNCNGGEVGGNVDLNLKL